MRAFLKKPIFLLLLPALGLFCLFFLTSNSVSAQTEPKINLPKILLNIPQRPFFSVCNLPALGLAHCHAKVVTNTNTTPKASPNPPFGSLGPVQIHTAYQLPCTPGSLVQSVCATPASFGPQTIAIIDAFHYPTVETDLTTYSNNYGLPVCTQANGCLTVVDQNGLSNLPSLIDPGWALEAALDIQTAHMICQTCKILFIETNSNTITDLGTGVNTAARLGATAISNSYGGSEFLGEQTYDSYYNQPGIAVTVSSGDSGYGAEYPASSPNVIAVGGTTLQLFTDSTYSNETAWSGAGSGCSRYETANSWQLALPTWNLTNCGSKRASADIAAVADPNTGVAIYDGTPYNGSTGWWQIGGTSLSAPIIAAAFALGGGVPPNTQAATLLYQNPNAFHDVTTGSNGNCATIMCKGAIGFDGPTGLGTPNTAAGFGNSAPITPTPTPTPTPDTQPPSVSITNPINGSTVRRRNKVNLAATASDNIAVTKVEFYINGTLYRADTTSPYKVSWNVPNTRNATYTILAKAYDLAGNTATNSVTVTAR